MTDNIYALFIYHRLKNGFEKWEFRKDVITAHPDLYLEDLFLKIYGFNVKGGSWVDATVTINGTKFKGLHVVYGGGYEMALAERIK